MSNTPILQTERLLLRPFTEADAEAFFLIHSDREVNTFLPWFPVQDIAEARALLQKQYLDTYLQPQGYRYAVCLREDNLPIGYVAVSSGESRDFGYGLRRDFWRQGMITEACRAVILQMKRDRIPFITATHDVNNPRSGHVMQRLGMTYQYSYREQWQPKNFPVIFRMYQLNLCGEHPVYKKYWEMYDVHFVEEIAEKGENK